VQGIPSDTGFAPCNVVHDETSTESKIQTEQQQQQQQQVEDFRSIYVPFVQRGDVGCIGGNHCDTSSSSPKPLSMQVEVSGAAANKSPGRYQAADEWRFIDGYKNRMISFSKRGWLFGVIDDTSFGLELQEKSSRPDVE